MMLYFSTFSAILSVSSPMLLWYSPSNSHHQYNFTIRKNQTLPKTYLFSVAYGLQILSYSIVAYFIMNLFYCSGRVFLIAKRCCSGLCRRRYTNVCDWLIEALLHRWHRSETRGTGRLQSPPSHRDCTWMQNIAARRSQLIHVRRTGCCGLGSTQSPSWSTAPPVCTKSNNTSFQTKLTQLLFEVALWLNEVNRCWARLVLDGWPSADKQNIVACNQPPRPTQPGYLCMCTCNEYQWKLGCKTCAQHNALVSVVSVASVIAVWTGV